MWAVANSAGVRTSSRRGPCPPAAHSRKLVASMAVGRVLVRMVEAVVSVMGSVSGRGGVGVELGSGSGSGPGDGQKRAGTLRVAV